MVGASTWSLVGRTSTPSFTGPPPRPVDGYLLQRAYSQLRGLPPIRAASKSEAGNRTMSLPQALVDILAEHLALIGLSAADADSLVFPAPGGTVWSYANYRRRMWLPAASNAGLAGIGFHDLRRTAATQLVLANVDMKTAGTRLGHSDPRLTLAVYAQATSEADRAAADIVGGRFATAMGYGDLDRFSIDTPGIRSAGAGTPAELHVSGRAARI